MDYEGMLKHVSDGEGLMRELKRCGSLPGADTFETICSFANRQGGNLFLGVTDEGQIEGIQRKRALEVKRNIANVLNNPRLFDPAPLAEIEDIACDEETVVLRVWVPMGPAVYRYKGVVYDRLADADVRITGVDQIALLYARKQNLYTENRVYKYIDRSEIRDDLIERARRMAVSKSPDHPWSELTNDELLRSARLVLRNRDTGEEGFTLASVLLLGTDELIADVCPAYRTDAIYRHESTDRYDDRLIVETNLIEAYDQLTEFARRHLPDRFALEGDQRVSARDIIVRELVSNSLIHREYLSPLVAKIVIDNGAITTQNASRALYEGRLNLSDFNPIPKNPTIARFFASIGRAEELGSGVRNLNRYSLLYSGKVPILEDGDVFRAEVPVLAGGRMDGDLGAITLVSSIVARDGFVTSSSLAKAAGVTTRTAQRRIRHLVEAGRLVESSARAHSYVVADPQ